RVPGHSAPADQYAGECGSYPPPNFSIGEWTIDLVRLQSGRFQEVAHLHGPIRAGRQECGIYGNVANVSSSHVELGKPFKVEIARGSNDGKDLAPDNLALCRVWKRKCHGETQ